MGGIVRMGRIATIASKGWRWLSHISTAQWLTQVLGISVMGWLTSIAGQPLWLVLFVVLGTFAFISIIWSRVAPRRPALKLAAAPAELPDLALASASKERPSKPDLLAQVPAGERARAQSVVLTIHDIFKDEIEPFLLSLQHLRSLPSAWRSRGGATAFHTLLGETICSRRNVLERVQEAANRYAFEMEVLGIDFAPLQAKIAAMAEPTVRVGEVSRELSPHTKDGSALRLPMESFGVALADLENEAAEVARQIAGRRAQLFQTAAGPEINISKKIARADILRRTVPKLEAHVKEAKRRFLEWCEFPRDNKVWGIGLASGNQRYFKQQYEGWLSQLVGDAHLWNDIPGFERSEPREVEPAELMGKKAPHEANFYNEAGTERDPDLAFLYRGWRETWKRTIECREVDLAKLRTELLKLEGEIQRVAQ